MYPSSTKDKSSIGYILFVLMAGVLILLLSIARASLEIWAQENNEGKVRVDLIDMTIFNEDGSTQPVTYKLPEVGMLPNNPFYGFKQIRDWLWINLSRTPLDKAKIALLIADKKMVEGRELFKGSNSNQAIEAASEALVKLKYASDQLKLSNDKVDETKQTQHQIVIAGMAYKEVLLGAKETFGMDTSKYDKLVSDLDTWNEAEASKIN